MIFRLILALLALPLAAASLAAADLDLTGAVVVTPPGLTGPPVKAVRMLVEEVEQRAMVRWDRAEKWPGGGTPVVVVALAGKPYALGTAADEAAAVVYAFLAGQRGAQAVAEVLLGELGGKRRA